MSYRIEDLRWTGVSTFRTRGTGRYYPARNGKLTEERVGESFIPTKFGEIPEDQWYELMEEAVRFEDKTVILDALIERCRSLAWLHTEEAIRRYALELLAGGHYELIYIGGKLVLK